MSTLNELYSNNPSLPRVEEVHLQATSGSTISAPDGRNSRLTRKWSFVSPEEQAKYTAMSNSEQTQFKDRLAWTGSAVPRESPGWVHGGQPITVTIKSCEPGTNAPR
jgi:hypothetical protein